MLTWGVAGPARFLWLAAWLLLPAWIALIWYGHRQRRRQGRRFGEIRLAYRTIDPRIWKSAADHRRALSGPSDQNRRLVRNSLRIRSNLKTVILMTALVMILAALGRPQWGSRQEEVHQQGIDLVLCVDTSESMKAQDVAPSRLDKARSVIGSLLSQLGGNRVGLVGFATTTRLHCPLTLDFRGLRSILDHSFSFGPGTDVEAAIAACVRVLEHSDARSRAVVLISDGEDHGGDLDNAIDMARKNGIRIFTLGIGTPEGGPIPLGDGEADGYKKKDGELVWTRLEEDTMKRLAEETGGKYYRATATETEAVQLAADVAGLEKSEFSQTVVTRREDQFGIFLLIAALLLALETALESYRTIAWEDADEVT
ncbi:MAG TPA: VWA domain-containing protein [bacterium]|nr:VWA domain-containing protein [bacterium]